MDENTIKIIIQVGPYIAPVLLTQAIKISLNIPRRWTPVLPFIIAWILLILKTLGLGQVFGWAVFWGLVYEGAIIGAVSIALYNLLQKTVLGK